MQRAHAHAGTLKLRTALVVAVLWLTGLTAAASLFHLARKSSAQAQSALEDQARNYAHLIAAHDRYGFALADALLQSVIDQLDWTDFNQPLTASRHAEVVSLLRRHRDRLAGIASFTIIGADGIRRAGVVNRDGTDLNHRQYFQELKSGRNFYLSNAEEGLASGKTGIHVARRFNGAQGEFGGVVVINLAVEEVFYPFYKSLRLGTKSTTTLQDAHKTLLVFPKESDSERRGSDAVTEAAASLIASGADRGARSFVDASDGIQRVAAIERLQGSNIVATVSLSAAETLERTSLIMWISGLGALASLLTTLAATVMFSRSRLFADARDQALQSEGEKRQLIHMIHQAIEEERRHIALEIHDALNAAVVGARLEAHQISAIADGAASGIALAQIKSRAASLMAMLQPLYERGRAIIERLRPEALDTLGLRAAIEEMVQHHDSSQPGCAFSFECSGDIDGLGDRLSMACYRIVQEALSNAVKHSQASRVAVLIHRDEASLQLVIVDNGTDLAPVPCSS
jgi:signal transduction histidine kinase